VLYQGHLTAALESLQQAAAAAPGNGKLAVLAMDPQIT